MSTESIETEGLPSKGFLRNYSLPRMLIYLSKHRLSGMLSISTHGDVKKIFIRKGNPVYATSTYPDDRLGEMLFKLGVITMRQYDAAVDSMKRTGKKLGATFVEFGYLSPRELFGGIRMQVMEIIYSLFPLRDGIYEFEENVAPPADAVTLELSMANVIYEGVKRITDWTRIKNELPDMENILMLSDDPLSLFQDITMKPEEKRILSLIDAERTIEEVIEGAEMSSFDAMKIIYVLWTIGMVTEQFNLQMSGLTIDDILAPVDDRKEEFISRVHSIYDVLDALKPHQLLAVEPNADFEHINRQYYKLSKEFHPDRYPDIKDMELKDKISGIFSAITTAYHQLKRMQTKRQFTEGDEDLARELMKVARTAIAQKSWKRAVTFLREATGSNPDCAECWYELSKVLRQIPGETDSAEEAAINAHGLDQDNPDYMVNLGTLYLEIGHREEAKELFEQALSVDSEHVEAQKALSLFLSGEG